MGTLVSTHAICVTKWKTVCLDTFERLQSGAKPAQSAHKDTAVSTVLFSCTVSVNNLLTVSTVLLFPILAHSFKHSHVSYSIAILILINYTLKLFH